MKLGSITLLFVVLLTLVLCSSGGRNLQTSPKHQVNDPLAAPEPMNKTRGQFDDEKAGGWGSCGPPCWPGHSVPHNRRLLTLRFGRPV